MKNRKKIKVGVLGATGSVGQRFVQLLDQHPWFELAGRRKYREVRKRPRIRISKPKIAEFCKRNHIRR